MASSNFFIIGAQRSGTSLFSRVLNAHPNLAVPPESFFFNTFAPLAPYYGNLGETANLNRLIQDALSTPKISNWKPAITSDQVRSRLSEPTLASVFSALMDSWTASQGKTRWGEKTPHHVFFWDEIANAFPKAKIIHITRDPRDTTASLVNARFGSATLFMAARRWRHYMQKIEEIRVATSENHVFRFKYEDLIMNPAEILPQITTFLGEEYEPEMLNFHKSGEKYSNYATEDTLLKSPLQPQNAYKWRESMSQRNVRLVESVVGDMLPKMGYENRFEMQKMGLRNHLYHTYIENPPRKAVAYLRNRPGQKEEFALAKMRLKLMLDSRRNNR